MGALTYEERIDVLESLRNQLISLFHNNPKSCHFGPLRSAKLVARDCYWVGLDTTVWKCIAGCEVCHLINAPCHAHYKANMPLSLLYNPYNGFSKDVITDIPEWTRSGYSGICSSLIDWLGQWSTCSVQRILTHQNWHLCFLSTWFRYVAYQSTPSLTSERW